MPIIDLQRAYRELGRIRLGTKGPKGEPRRLETLRFTSNHADLIEQIAETYGGTPAPWNNETEVITDTNEVPVAIPPQRFHDHQWFEEWTAGGLVRRCNGETQTNGKPCQCDPNNRRCHRVTQIVLMLPDIADIGVWRLRTSGYYASVELATTIDQLDSAATGEIVLGTLALELRDSLGMKGDAKKVFVVPVLRFPDVRLRSLIEQAAAAKRLPAGSVEVAGLPPRSPVPLPQPVPVVSVEESGGLEALDAAAETTGTDDDHDDSDDDHDDSDDDHDDDIVKALANGNFTIGWEGKDNADVVEFPSGAGVIPSAPVPDDPDDIVPGPVRTPKQIAIRTLSESASWTPDQRQTRIRELCAAGSDGTGRMMEIATRTLFGLMNQEGYWSDTAMYAAIAKTVDGGKHYADLGRVADQRKFLARTIEAAAKVMEGNEPK